MLSFLLIEGLSYTRPASHCLCCPLQKGCRKRTCLSRSILQEHSAQQTKTVKIRVFTRCFFFFSFFPHILHIYISLVMSCLFVPRGLLRSPQSCKTSECLSQDTDNGDPLKNCMTRKVKLSQESYLNVCIVYLTENTFFSLQY